jgi:hypothetical protein
LIIPRRKTSLVEALHGKATMAAMGSSPERERRGKGQRERERGWGAPGGAVGAARGAGKVYSVRSCCCCSCEEENSREEGEEKREKRKEEEEKEEKEKREDFPNLEISEKKNKR